MNPNAADPDAADFRPRDHRTGRFLRAARGVLFGITLFFVLVALSVSAALVVYTAWRHDLGRGLFALVFAVLSAQIALNWLLWKEDAGGS